MFLMFAMVVSISAQTIALSGKVTNQSGKPIANAVVALVTKGLLDTTDAAGTFSFSSGTGVNFSTPQLSGDGVISVKNGIVMVNLTKMSPVKIELFDMRGKLLGRVIDNYVSAGNYKFDMMRLPLATSMMMVRVMVGQNTFNFRSLPFAKGHQTVTSSAVSSMGGVLAKLQAEIDSLKVSATGYTSKTVMITSYDLTVDISLDTVVCKANPSKPLSTTVTGSGPHKVVIETNSDPGIKSGTIYRPSDLGPGKNYPIFVWGEGACAQDGLSNKASMGEIASWGYFIVADGSSAGGGGTAAALLAYITWAIAENRNPCSAILPEPRHD